MGFSFRMSGMTEVIKKDGSREPFDVEKIRNVTKAAGLDDAKVNDLCEKITKWVDEKGSVTTPEIREQVLSYLKTNDPYVYGLFKWYEDSKDKHNA